MSETSSLVSAEHFRYVAERTAREDAFLQDLKRAAAAEGIPAIWIAPEQASFMQILLRLAKARGRFHARGHEAAMKAVVHAPAWLPGGNLQTIWPALFGRRTRGEPPHYRRERWTTPDADFLDVDWLLGAPDGAPPSMALLACSRLTMPRLKSPRSQGSANPKRLGM